MARDRALSATHGGQARQQRLQGRIVGALGLDARELTDETGEWEIVGRPYSSSAGKIASARARAAERHAAAKLRPRHAEHIPQHPQHRHV